MNTVRLKLWQKTLYYTLFVLAIIITIGLPIYVLWQDLIKEYWHVEKAKYSFITAFTIGAIGVSSYFPLKAWYKRKLQAMEVANELNVVGLTSPFIKWLLLFLQFAVPLGVITAVIYAFTFIEIPNYKLFLQFYGYFIGGFAVFIFNDYLKIAFLRKNEVEQQVKLDEKKAKYVAKKRYKINK